MLAPHRACPTACYVASSYVASSQLGVLKSASGAVSRLALIALSLNENKSR